MVVHTTSNPIKGSSYSGEIYIKGNKYIEGSKRLSLDKNKKYPTVEELIDGIWQPTSFKTGPKSVWLGESVGLGSIGHHVVTEATDGHFHYHAHGGFDPETGLSTFDARIIYAHSHTDREIFQSDNTGTFTGTLLEYNFEAPAHLIADNIYYQTDATAATESVRIEIFEGTDDTGALVFDQTYPASQFPANSEVEAKYEGYVEYNEGENYYLRYTSDANFSFKMDSTNTVPWLAADNSLVREDDMLQTPEWIADYTFEEEQLSIQNNNIYACNTDATQTGTFEDNSDLWNKFRPNNFSYNEVTSPKITIYTEQQMIVNDGIKIDGELIINGDLSLIST